MTHPVRELTEPVIELTHSVRELTEPLIDLAASVHELAVPVIELAAPVHELPVPVIELAAPVHELPVPVIELATPVHELPVPVIELAASVHELTVPVIELAAPVHELPEPVTERPSSAFCLLPSAFCLLPSAFCLLPSAFRHLPSAIRFLPSAICHPLSALIPEHVLLEPPRPSLGDRRHRIVRAGGGDFFAAAGVAGRGPVLRDDRLRRDLVRRVHGNAALDDRRRRDGVGADRADGGVSPSRLDLRLHDDGAAALFVAQVLRESRLDPRRGVRDAGGAHERDRRPRETG